jgi:hypothetical protein
VSIPLLATDILWTCPNCPFEDVTHDGRPHTRYHQCAGLNGILAPMVRKGVKASVRAVERGDYIGTEDVPLTEGRPVMSVVTEREDGQDVTVFAPTAHARGDTNGLV